MWQNSETSYLLRLLHHWASLYYAQSLNLRASISLIIIHYGIKFQLSNLAALYSVFLVASFSQVGCVF